MLMEKFDWKNLKLKNKYYFFKINKKTNKVSSLNKGNSKSELTKDIYKNKKINSDYEVVLFKFEFVKEWHPDKKIPINMIGGPIKIKFDFFSVSPKNKLKKVEDKRIVQMIYYTLDYYKKNKIKSLDLKKVAELAFLNKLEKRLMAPKIITQINIQKSN